MSITHNGMKLVYKKTGLPVNQGDIVVDHAGYRYTVDSGQSPHREGSTGRIYVMGPQANMPQGFFPSVFDCKWVSA